MYPEEFGEAEGEALLGRMTGTSAQPVARDAPGASGKDPGAAFLSLLCTEIPWGSYSGADPAFGG